MKIRELSPYHLELLDIIFGRKNPAEDVSSHEILPRSAISHSSLDLLYRLVLIEYHASLTKEVESDEDSASSNGMGSPKPFDVFTVAPTFSNKNISVAVCVPTKKRRAELRDEDLVWLDESDTYWQLHELEARRKVSSLSGTARVLQNLEQGLSQNKLMCFAMERRLDHILDRSTLGEALLSMTPSLSALNPSQLLAVNAIASAHFSRGFFIIQGPPGTGKTTTLVEMIIAADEQLVVSAPSNAATSNVALKLFHKSSLNIMDICVYGNNCDDSVRFLNPMIRQQEFCTFGEKYGEQTEEARKHLLRRFAVWLHLNPSDFDSDRELYGRVAKLCIGGEKLYLCAKAVFCTLNSAGSPFFRTAAGMSRRTFFLDEAGQCTEAEFYIATTFPGIKRVVVIGDPKQLPATVIDRGCINAGFARSWMENVAYLHPKKIHLLDTQYRMDPKILEFPNRTFYNRRIQSHESVLNRSPLVSLPIAFIGTDRQDAMEEKERFSWRNPGEATIIRAMIRRDEDIQSLLKHQTPPRVVVITPYRAQASLLEAELRKVKCLSGISWSVSTVDSFQGQEADVVIISTVRSDRIGFVDDPNRINVALTRAKRVLRVVGSSQLLSRLGKSSVLNQLLADLKDKKSELQVPVRNAAFSFPDWRRASLWKATMTARFHHCLKEMEQREQALALRTLQAVVIPIIRVLSSRPNNSYWQISALRGSSSCIVWVAKEDMTIEVHFAGSKNMCLRFLQTNVIRLPARSCKVQSDLSGIIYVDTNSADSEEGGSMELQPRWSLSNALQKAIGDKIIDKLPQGCFLLDPEQQAIVDSSPPLLLESRSGTGKTNVLFSHIIKASRDLVCSHEPAMPLCFITVSKLLRTQLEQLYKEVKGIDDIALQSCVFLSLTELLDGLAERVGLLKFSASEATSLNEYIISRRSHAKIPVDETLLENEIGGVIMGSLDSAQKGRPLTWEEYKENIRSNISLYEVEVRRNVYDEYCSYQGWKSQNGLTDLNDIVLAILLHISRQNKFYELFSSVYLDECQDFSYAMIFLICSIGGRAHKRWIFAGDTAQMISPGCSFKFSGLKQVLLSIQSGIESDIKQVSHLLLNYRTTKHILQVGNAILSLAKKNHPGAIEFAGEERAVNDYGISVILCDWARALQTVPSFGEGQALIYSTGISASNDEGETVSKFKTWLNDHPFILSALDSKGLEFDDVVVAFSMDRASWKADSKEASALSLLRELYVAVTRAKRRVVILIKRGSDTMQSFMSHLNCELEHHPNPVELFKEFNTSTSAKQWLKRADDLFSEERYEFASRCYGKAKAADMEAWALGRYFVQKRDRTSARNWLSQACDILYQRQEFELVLDVTIELLSVSDWSEQPPQFVGRDRFDECLSRHPRHLAGNQIATINMFCDEWSSVTLDQIRSNVGIFNQRRDFPGLLFFLQGKTSADLEELSSVAPCIIGDIYYTQKKYDDSTKLYLAGQDYSLAAQSSEDCILAHRKNDTLSHQSCIFRQVDLWRPHVANLRHQGWSIPHLLRFVDDPEGQASNNSSTIMDMFGSCVVKRVVEKKELSPLILHSFSAEIFYVDIVLALEDEVKRDETKSLTSTVNWFLDRGDKESATKYVHSHLSGWTDDVLLSFVKKGICSLELAKELHKRQSYIEAISLYLACNHRAEALSVSNQALSTRKRAESHISALVSLWRDQGVVGRTPNYIKKQSRLWYALRLFNDPLSLSLNVMEKATRKECLGHFGAGPIQDAVLKKAPHYQKSQVQDGNRIRTVEAYVDASKILLQFGRDAVMPRRKILERLWQYEVDTGPFINCHLRDWTMVDMHAILKRGYRSYEVASELARRARYPEAAAMYLAIGERHEAVIASNRALRPPGLALQNAHHIASLWLTPNFKDRRHRGDRIDGALGDLLLLCQDPLRASFTSGPRCFAQFGKSFVSDAVLRFAPYKAESGGVCDEFTDIFSRFHPTAFETDGLIVIKYYMGKQQTKEAGRVVNTHVAEWTDEELLTIAELSIQPVPRRLPAEFRKREFYYESALHFVRMKQYDEAAISSNDDLRKYPLPLSKAKKIVAMWDGAIGRDTKDLPGYITRTAPQVALLLSLFRDPLAASLSNDAATNAYAQAFGPEAIHGAVLSKYPFSNEGNAPEIDPLEVLARFRVGAGMSKVDVFRQLLDLEAKAKEKRRSKRYANANVQYWSKYLRKLNSEDILSLVNFGARPTGISHELRRRGEHIKSVELFISEGETKEAITSSNAAISSLKLADQNAGSIVQLWMKDTNRPLIPQSSKLWLLLYLFSDPLAAANTFGRQCVSSFGKKVVEAAVNRKHYSYSTEAGEKMTVDEVLLLFDPKIFLKKGRGNKNKSSISRSRG
mmetsp:Transcript_20346/g.58415  ORF Transcript_20346/g.58415 Transcript_20346/m.58415 type:complete len:2357 (+) Transcript_20346:2738-9808(+)